MTKAERTCAIPGCQRPWWARDWCNTHYQRWQKSGDPLKTSDSPSATRTQDNPDGTRTCSKCSTAKDITEFAYSPHCLRGRRGTCKACVSADEKLRDKSHRDSATYEYKRRERFRRKYGITIAEYEQMLTSQQGLCAICRKPDAGWNRGNVMVVDHDHVTGAVRGLLCHWCNSLLGQARDNVDVLTAAIAYLQPALEPGDPGCCDLPGWMHPEGCDLESA